MPPYVLDAEFAARLVGVALGHVTREYPHKLDDVLDGPQTLKAPRDLHPVFFGSFDWHSCVHGYWLLARALRRFPAAPFAAEIADLFERQLTADKIAAECAYFDAPSARGFERPYGWAWALKLAGELAAAPRGSDAMAPLARRLARRLYDFLPLSPYPVRAGAHASSAFALRLAADYAEATGDEALAARLVATARRWFGADEACPAWGEPSGEDFLSPTLIEAEAMRRLLPAPEFALWFDRFLPHIPPALFVPAEVRDRADGKIAHLDGLNLSRAWCFAALAGSLPPGDARAAPMRRAAQDHLAASLPHLAADYMGAHWLGSFAWLALEASDPNPPPR